MPHELRQMPWWWSCTQRRPYTADGLYGSKHGFKEARAIALMVSNSHVMRCYRYVSLSLLYTCGGSQNVMVVKCWAKMMIQLEKPEFSILHKSRKCASLVEHNVTSTPHGGRNRQMPIMHQHQGQKHNATLQWAITQTSWSSRLSQVSTNIVGGQQYKWELIVLTSPLYRNYCSLIPVSGYHRLPTFTNPFML